MKGVYTLIIEIPKNLRIPIGRKHIVAFERGVWVYVGSALGEGSTSIENRLARHFKQNKKIHWHIDFLLKSNVVLSDALWAESDLNRECTLVQELLATGNFIPSQFKFGASDCTQRCQSHLLQSVNESKTHIWLKMVFEILALTPKSFSDLQKSEYFTR